MHRIVVAVLGATALGSAVANAADMPLKAPPLPVRYNWTGCYIGGHIGADWARTEWTNTKNTTNFGDLDPGEGFTHTDGSFIGGGQLGCNYQTGPWVFGIEGTFAGSTIKNDITNTVFNAAGPPNDVFTIEVQSVATVTGRLGYAWDNWLLYAKGGYAGADIKLSVSNPHDGHDMVGPSGSGSETNWHNGWTAGVGVEYGLTPNWILGVEYDYMGLETRSHEIGGGAGLYTFDVKPQIQQVVARVSYKFWP